MCILNNENPLIRYYLPSHHPPLGPLANPPEAAPVPTQAEGSSRWRSAMATNIRSSSGTSENDEHISKRLAYLVQQELDEYRKANHDFPVSAGSLVLARVTKLVGCVFCGTVESDSWGDRSTEGSPVYYGPRDGSCSASYA